MYDEEESMPKENTPAFPPDTGAAAAGEHALEAFLAQDQEEDMPKGHPISVKKVPWHLPVEDGMILKPASRSGYWNLVPEKGGNAVRTMIPAREAAWLWPAHNDAILGKPDSTD